MEGHGQGLGQPTASVIVAARGGQEQFDGLLGRLEEQTLPRSSWELILVDDGSPVPLGADAAARTIRIETPVGAYAARNAALDVARGSVMAITDVDCLPEPAWLEKLVGTLGAADMAAGAIRVTVGSSPGLAERIDAARNLDQRSYASRGFAAFANFGCRRAVIDAVGPFNSQLVSNGDREFCMRAIDAGFSLEYAPGAVVEHAALRGARALAGRSFRLGRGRAQSVVHAAGPARERRRNWLPLGSYLPSARAGRMAMDVAEYALVGIPTAAGYAFGAVEARLGSGRRARRARSTALPEAP